MQVTRECLAAVVGLVWLAGPSLNHENALVVSRTPEHRDGSQLCSVLGASLEIPGSSTAGVASLGMGPKSGLYTSTRGAVAQLKTREAGQLPRVKTRLIPLTWNATPVLIPTDVWVKTMLVPLDLAEGRMETLKNHSKEARSILLQRAR